MLNKLVTWLTSRSLRNRPPEVTPDDVAIKDFAGGRLLWTSATGEKVDMALAPQCVRVFPSGKANRRIGTTICGL